ncbi:MAG: vitamin B12/bleomycin/antimicrobial peptide transport system ATP-binding/permease protein [Alphaproteobacteria bacterium]|nr:vitamin B12/bleomycin/antimicrobial peptide transport system ATP-binding/permease protein [Alphaproteobacteria bacterium]
MKGIAPTLATIWRLASPYFYSEDRKAGRILLAAVIATELSLVAINVLLNQWNNRFYNALQDRNWDAFVTELLFFCVLAGAYILLAVYQVYLNQWLQIRWRQWMTKAYLGDWLTDANHYRMQLLGDAADNPDQRIAEDIQMFVERTLTIGIGLLSALVTLGSFVIILWTLSVEAPLHLFGGEWNIPGYLVWAALIYAVIGTYFTHLIGWPLVTLNFNQQRFEADFRFNLVRVRENSEQIALLKGELAETDRLVQRFGRVVANWLLIMSRTKKLTFFTASYSQVSIVFPYVVVSPAYFAGKMQLGGLMQTASAFNSVQTALSFFINVYRSLAEWRSVIQRLDGFSLAVAAAQAAAHTPPRVEVQAGDTGAVELRDVAVNLPTGTPLVAVDNVKLPRGEPALVTGPSGSGKSTLFRAIAGIWPFGSGRVVVPKDAHLMMLPQRPYFPVGPLAAAVSYPAEAGSYDRERVAEAITAVGLPALAQRIDEEAHWNRMLSLGEQQRLGIARALLQKPDFLFLDEATASLDEPAEAALYRLLQERLPNATVVSIGHRSTLAAFHRRGLALERDGDRFKLREAALKPAAE